MRSFFETAFGGMATVIMIIFWILIAVGGLYWFWMSIQLGSFLMFLIGAFPPTAILVATPLGAWSLLFGVPEWIFNVFG